MTNEEQARKLDFIARMNAEELEGWVNCVKEARPYFDGEQAAILKRARELGVTL